MGVWSIAYQPFRCVHSMSTAPQYRPHYTVADYNLWEGDWELWQGTAVAMTPSPFGRHARLLIAMGTALNLAIRESGCSATVLAEIDWIVADDTVLRPDITVVCGDAPERHVESVPELVVEILSDSTQDRDRSAKRHLYERAGVRWYLIVDPELETIVALRLDDSGHYAEVDCGQDLAVDLCDCGTLSIDLTYLF